VSEYQFYEFQAVDRPLTPDEMRTLRGYSSRATITPSRFVNEYHWGDLKGNPYAWMERYFDAFLYYANWGTHELMLRLPRRSLDLDLAQRYCVSDDHASVSESGDHVILSFSSEHEGDEWLEEDDGALGSILPVRAEIASGDHRALYLAWILAAQSGELGDDEPEPPVPPGLRSLTAAQQAFCEFLRVDEDWIAVAAERSPAMHAEPGGDELRAWIAALPDAEKTALLVRVAEGEGAMVGAELVRRLRAENRPSAADDEPRTVGELFEAAERREAERRRKAAERAAREKARADAAKAAARSKHLDTLVGRENELWAQVEELIATRLPKRYDEAVQLLADLRDLAARGGREDQALARIEDLCMRYAKRPAFIQRVRKAVPWRSRLFAEADGR
jgi:hypothetical protein